MSDVFDTASNTTNAIAKTDDIRFFECDMCDTLFTDKYALDLHSMKCRPAIKPSSKSRDENDDNDDDSFHRYLNTQSKEAGAKKLRKQAIVKISQGDNSGDDNSGDVGRYVRNPKWIRAKYR